MKKYILLAACALGLSLSSCEDFLNYTPTAVVNEDKAFSDPEKMVNAAYAMLGIVGTLIRSTCFLMAT